MSTEATVFVLDNDALSRDAVRHLIRNMNLRCRAYRLGQEFLDEYDPAQPGCLITEVRIPDVSGLEIQRCLATHDPPLPVIFLTAHASVPVVVRAMQGGAMHFMEKPPLEQELWEAVQKAVNSDRQRREIVAEQEQFKKRLAVLTPKEQEVLKLLTQDKTLAAMAKELGVSLRTVELRRNSINRKLDTKTPWGVACFAIRALDGDTDHGCRSDASRRTNGFEPHTSGLKLV